MVLRKAVSFHPNVIGRILSMQSSLVKKLIWFAGNSDSLDVRDDPGAVRLCELKDRPALYAARLLPLGSIFLCELSGHGGGITVRSDFHTFCLDLHVNGTGLLKGVFVTSVQLSHSRPNLLQGVRVSLLKSLRVPLNQCDYGVTVGSSRRCFGLNRSCGSRSLAQRGQLCVDFFHKLLGFACVRTAGLCDGLETSAGCFQAALIVRARCLLILRHDLLISCFGALVPRAVMYFA